MNKILRDEFSDLIQKEADRLGVPIDQADALAEAGYEVMEEVLLQQAYEVVVTIQEARDSLPPFQNPTGDTPTLAELVGACL
jgi:hypothetical protein